MLTCVWDCATEGRAPPYLVLGIDNSAARGGWQAAAPLTRLSFFAPYWVDNRSGMDLVFQDQAAAGQAHGIRPPWAYIEVLAPGVACHCYMLLAC